MTYRDLHGKFWTALCHTKGPPNKPHPLTIRRRDVFSFAITAPSAGALHVAKAPTWGRSGGTGRMQSVAGGVHMGHSSV